MAKEKKSKIRLTHNTNRLTGYLLTAVNDYAKKHRIKSHQLKKVEFYIGEDLSIIPEEKIINFFEKKDELQITSVLLLRRKNATFQIKSFSLLYVEDEYGVMDCKIQISFRVNEYRNIEEFSLQLSNWITNWTS